MKRLRLAMGLLLMVPLILVAPMDSAQAYDCSTVPVGSWSGAAPAIQHPIWCVPLTNTAPATGVADAQGGWLDDFNHGASLAHFNNGDNGYQVYDAFGSGSTLRSTHWLHNNHWMVDMTHDNGGTTLRPSQAFHFENGKLILETDVAAGIPGYIESNGADIVWPEVAWSTQDHPVVSPENDSLYLYGHFKGAWASGCRLQATRSLTCALEADHDIGSLSTGDQPPCFGVPPARLIEWSGHQVCGSVHDGMSTDFGAATPSWRKCASNDPDTNCRDRFRLEWSKDGFRAWVNGVFFGEDRGWPLARQIPDSIVNGSTPVYAYFGEWGDFTDSNVYRFHWDRVAVNPHDSSGAILPLSAAASFCPGQPGDTCPTAPPPSPSPTPTPSGTPMPTPTATPSPTPTSPPPLPSTLLVGDQKVEATHDSNVPGQAQAYSYVASTSGPASTLQAYIDAPNSASSVVLGLYSNSGSNQPQTLLGQCSVTTVAVNAWDSCALTTPPSVVAGSKYWLTILGPASTGTIGYRDSASAVITYGSSSTSLTTLPATWASGPIWGSAPGSIYASS